MRARHMLVVMTAVALLAGCTSAPSRHTSGTAFAGTAAPTAELLRLDEGTVVATGELASVDGLTTGDVHIVAAPDGEFRLRIDDFVSPPGTDLIPNLSAEPFNEASYCDGGFMMLVLDRVAPSPSVEIDIHFGPITLGNPDFLDTLVITLNDADAPPTGCFYAVVATAPLTWTMPDMRPDMTVVDGGATGGATGAVVENASGPASYEVAGGDVLDEIAARFGISVADLFYLNPARGKGQEPLAYAGEVLNLDKGGR